MIQRFLFSLIVTGACADTHRVSLSRSSVPESFLSTLAPSPFSCHLSHCPLFSLGIPTPAPSSFLLNLLFSFLQPKQNPTTRRGLDCKGRDCDGVRGNRENWRGKRDREK